MIKILEKQVAARIAAGEVVERPLSIVKELVENAIDSGADSITVEIKKGGKEYIRITDNGMGIPSDEVALAFQRHATSKITADSDLKEIRSLGFRGEALPSIAAVSRVEMITKTADERTGTKLLIKGGEILENKGVGCHEGTTVTVTDLFYNTPVREKFMKSQGAEATLIIDFISKMALAYAAVKIRLINNDSILFSTQGRGDIYENVLNVYGNDIGRGLIPLSYGNRDLSVEGYISGPANSRSSRSYQIFFVNGRWVQSKVMAEGVDGAYSDRLFEGRHPLAFLFLQIDPEHLDVNIHPNKKEIRFDDEEAVRTLVREGIKEALQEKEALPKIEEKSFFHSAQDVAIIQAETVDTNTNIDIKSLLSTMRAEKEACLIKETFDETKFDISSLNLVSSIFGTYILAVDEDSFYLIDQHAAHERIFFEQFMKSYQEEEKLSQPILVPFVMEIPHSIRATKSEWLETLNKAAFVLEDFGDRAFVVKEIPMFMGLEEAETFLKFFFDNIRETANPGNPVMLEKIISKACKSAVKGNDILNSEEIKQLLSDLSLCDNPLSCPHGRPTFVRMTKGEIEKLFKRV